MGARTLFLASGHGGADRGNTASGFVEADECVAIIGDVRRWFTAIGVPPSLGGAIFLDDGLDLNGQLQRLKLLRPTEADNDLCLDWHLDFAATRPAGGAMVITNDRPAAKQWAHDFLTQWCDATGIRSNGVHLGAVAAPKWRGWPDFGWTRPAWPACIVELGSLNNARDMRIVRDPLSRALAAHLAWACYKKTAL